MASSSDIRKLGSVKSLITKGQHLSSNLGKLSIKANQLLSESKKVDEEMMNCCKFRDEQLIKYLAENSSDEEQLQLLREHAELKQTVEEFQVGIDTIMAKYREHCEGDMLSDSYNLRDKYIANLGEIVKRQDERIEQMVQLMKLNAELIDSCNLDNQQTICNLAKENELMRCQLQISKVESIFQQGMAPSTENSTQVEQGEPIDTDATVSETSVGSLESFMTCLSNDLEVSSNSSSIVSEIEISRFIEQALTLTPAPASEELQ